MTDGSLTRPERAAQFRQARRYRAAVAKRGLCAVCIHREKGHVTAFGLNVCGISRERIAEHCQRDKRQPKFEVDAEALKEFADAA